MSIQPENTQPGDIQPEDMRAHLERQAQGGGSVETKAARAGPEASEAAPTASAGGAQPHGPEDPAREALLRSIAASYFSLRFGLALLALAMPLLLILLAGKAESSISAYYYHAAGGGLFGWAPRDILVGVLCAIGAFLWLYKGYRTRENIALNLAGIAAVAIALFPTDPEGTTARSFVGIVHQAGAFGYFVAIAYVAFFEAKTTLRLLHNPALERIYLSLYRLLAAAMVLLPAAVFLLHMFGTPNPEAGGVIFWLEFVAIYVFAAFWLVKSFEIRTIQRKEKA